MSWILTHSGKKVDPFNPNPNDIVISDIIHALSNICRFSGHTRRFYSVAEHSIFVSQHVDEEFKLTALLHDAAEAYLLDVPTPIKQLFPAYKEAEDRMLEIIMKKFGGLWPIPEAVKQEDERMLATEAVYLLDANIAEWGLKTSPYACNFNTETAPNSADLQRYFFTIFDELFRKVSRS